MVERIAAGPVSLLSREESNGHLTSFGELAFIEYTKNEPVKAQFLMLYECSFATTINFELSIISEWYTP